MSKKKKRAKAVSKKGPNRKDALIESAAKIAVFVHQHAPHGASLATDLEEKVNALFKSK